MLLSQLRSARECAKGTFFVLFSDLEIGKATAVVIGQGELRGHLEGVRVLNRRFILRYLILIMFLAICAGAAWYMAGTSGTHAADTVLARMEGHMGKYAVPRRGLPAETAARGADSCVIQEKVPAGYGVLRGDVLSEHDTPKGSPEGRLL